MSTSSSTSRLEDISYMPWPSSTQWSDLSPGPLPHWPGTLHGGDAGLLIEGRLRHGADRYGALGDSEVTGGAGELLYPR